MRIECDELRARSKELDAYLNGGFGKAAAEVGASLAALLVLHALVLAQLSGSTRSIPFGR